MESYFSNINLFQLLWKWKWHLVILCLIAGILAAIFSGPVFIKPRYRSTAVIYPSNISPYSDESETEQMVQWLNSKDIKDSVIARFDLAKHYKLDPSYKYFYSTLLYMYDKNVSINKTMYESVEIEIMDTDPVIAYEMVNAVLEFYNTKVRAIHREKYQEVVDIYAKVLNNTYTHIDSLDNRMSEIRTTYGIIDYPQQAREVARGFLRTVDGDNAAHNINTPEVIKLKKSLEEFGGEYNINNQRIYDLLRLYAALEEDYARAYLDANKEFTYTNIVTPPTVADKKAFPVRWLIVLYSMVATLFLSVIVITIIESRQLIKPGKSTA